MKRIELEFVCPPETVVVVDGKDIVITPIRIGKLPALLRAVEPAFADLLALVDNPGVDTALRLAGERGELVCDVVALCTGLAQKEVEAMLPDRVAALLIVCCEVNWDFFVQAVPKIGAQADLLAPHLAGKLAKLSLSPLGDGQQPSAT